MTEQEWQDCDDVRLMLAFLSGNATERIRLVDAPSDAVVHLDISADEKILELDRITATKDGLPIEWRVILMRADKPYSD